MPPESAGPAVESTPPPATSAPDIRVQEFGWSEPASNSNDWLENLFKDSTQEQKDKAAESGSSPATTPGQASSGSQDASPPKEPEAKAPPAAPPAPQTKAPEQPTESGAREPATAAGDLFSRDLTDAEVEELLQRNPALGRRIERLADNKLGNKLTERAKADAEWKKATEYWDGIEALGASTEDADREKYRTLMADPDVATWRANYLKVKAEREAPPAPVVDESTRQSLVDAINLDAATSFASVVKAAPWYSQLPAELRGRIEGARQTSSDKTWLEEWAGDFIAASEKYWKAEMQRQIDAAHADASASQPSKNPPSPSQSSGPAWNADDIIARHAANGFGRDGVSQEQLDWAKAQKGYDW